MLPDDASDGASLKDSTAATIQAATIRYRYR